MSTEKLVRSDLSPITAKCPYCGRTNGYNGFKCKHFFLCTYNHKELVFHFTDSEHVTAGKDI